MLIRKFFKCSVEMKCYLFKGITIQSQFFFEKPILYVKVTVSQKHFFQYSVLNSIQVFYLHGYNNVSNTH